MLETNILQLIIFTILATFMLGGSLTMISAKQTYISAFGFLVAMIGLAGMFALLDNRFLAVAQIMVSVGAIVVLSILTILTINAKEENLPDEPYKFLWIIFTSILVAPFTYLLYKVLTTLPQHFAEVESINTKVVGELLFSEWVLPFEIVSILLLTAMLGAIIITKDKLKGEKS
ncbi:MAG: NADH-quinone oxidoreductase subunit J [Campylobacterota bacterium]|nr:NADH-quinone oxidoreductase subunit J [Campylobacterota bacterium]